MGEPAQMQQLAEELVNGLVDQVKPEVLYKAWDLLGGRLSQLHYEKLEAKYDEDADENGDEPYTFECPHCLEEFEYDYVRAIDWALRKVDSHERDGEQLNFDSDEESHDGYEDLVYVCRMCGHAVDLPQGWTAEWM